MALLEIADLSVSFPTQDGLVKAVDHVSLKIREGRKVGLIGETGCGKTVLGMAIVRLLQSTARIKGRIAYRGRDLLLMKEGEMRRLRGREIAMILQNPTTSLNPVLKVGDQIAEAIRLHLEKSREEALNLAVKMLEEVHMPDPARRARQYPHELSGGMRERVLIAMALACRPSFIIADEPTKGLDAKTKMQIIDLIKGATQEKSLMMITHDLGVAGQICDQIAVMYAGEILEWGSSEEILSDPCHPYTRGFINSHPSRGLVPIPGSSPSLIDFPSGCKFHPRCALATDICKTIHPEMKALEEEHSVRCHLCT
ncbi:MAG: ABC transporter ATP-binding protein [Methanotrichaceae archaeon]|nr:ABC transporter ATP-binding protein [Methanotrichaceae archaeon]